MPSVSKKQHNLMAAVANNPAFAKKAGIPQSVGSEFIKADKGKKFVKGGDMKKLPPFMGKETKAEEAKEMKIKAKSKALYDLGEKTEDIHGTSGMKKPTKYAGGGFTKAADGMAQRGHTKAQKFDMGGAVDPNATAAPPAGRLYQSTPARAAAPVAAPVAAPMLDRRAQRRAEHDARRAAQAAQRANRPARPAMQAASPAAPVSTDAAIRQMYAANPTAMRFNPNGPDAQAMDYWRNKIGTQGLQAVQGGGFANEVKAYEDADFAKRMAERRAANPMKKGGAVKPKAYAKGGCVSSTPAMKSGGDVKKARGGGCEVKGKTKGRYI